MTDSELRGQSLDGALRGFARLAGMTQGVSISALALTSPSWRRTVADASVLGDYTARMLSTGLPGARVRRVLEQELGRTGPMTMEDRCRSALARLLQGPPYDGTNQRFEAMVTAREERSGDARTFLLSLFDSGIFRQADMDAMRERDINDDE